MRSRLAVWAVCALVLAIVPTTSHAAGIIVISQIYGGGGNSGATLKNDFVELFNRGDAPVTMTGWSLQYASATGSGWGTNNSPAALPTATINPGQYFLVQLAAGAGGTVALPTPDATGNLALSGSVGKVALVNSVTPLSGPNPSSDSSVVDFVGYGNTPNGSETAPTGTALTNTTAVFRKNAGCTDTNNNANDFDPPAAPAPRNSASPTHSCGALSAAATANPNPAVAGTTVLLIVQVAGGTLPYSVRGNLSSIGGDSDQQLYDDGTHGDVTAGDYIYSFSASVPCGTTAGDAGLPFSVVDSAGSPATVNPSLTLTVQDGATAFGVPHVAGVTDDNGQPSNVVTCAGGNATFSVVARGANLGYRWYNAAGPLDDTGNIQGSHTDTLIISNVQAADAAAGPYHCDITGSCTGTLSSDSATLTLATGAAAADKQIVINQVYGGGGNSGTYWTNDFVELFNKGTTPVDVTGWIIQYASSDTGGSQPKFDRPARYTVLSGTIQPGQYYLIQESQGNAGTHVLPTPDVDGTTQPLGPIFVGSQGGKIALVKAHLPNVTAAPVSGACPQSNCMVVDFLGWNTTATCFEGTAPGPATGNTTAIFRKSACVDTDDNAADFTTGTILDPATASTDTIPHNSASSTAPAIATSPADAHLCEGQSATFTVVATGACLNYQWQVKVDGNWVNVTTGTGGNTATYTTATIAAADSGTLYRVVVSNSFGPAATSTPAAVLIDPVTADDKQIVINQIYGGGGNTGAVYQNDFVELYNKGTTPVVVDGWSIQYASASGTNWSNKVNLSGTIQPGHYYLIKGAAGSSCAGLPCGVALPGTPNATSTLDLAGSNGKLALLKTTAQLGTVACPTSDCHVVDFVGYGTANCFEGTDAAPAPSATLSITRTPAGADTDQNGLDFVAGTPTPTHNAPGDFDGSGNVGTADYDLFVPCWTGPQVTGIAAGCADKDLDQDNDVDMVDFGLFQKCFTGPEPANPGCLN